MASEFPSNSNSQRPKREPAPEKNVQKVVTGRVTTRKRPLSKKFKDLFARDDDQSVIDYVLMDVAMPMFRDMIVAAGVSAVEQTFGGHASSGARRGSSRHPVNRGPGSRYANGPVSRDEVVREPLSRRARAAHRFDELVIDTRAEATDVLNQLRDLLDKYDEITVSDFYRSVGEDPDSADQKWGWDNLDAAYVTRARSGGYIIELPRPIALT